MFYSFVLLFLFTMNFNKTRMTTFIKTKLKKSDGQIKMECIGVAAHYILLNIIQDLLRHQKSEKQNNCNKCIYVFIL